MRARNNRAKQKEARENYERLQSAFRVKEAIRKSRQRSKKKREIEQSMLGQEELGPDEQNEQRMFEQGELGPDEQKSKNTISLIRNN